MTTFDKREEGFEKQFAHDEELRFKATARRHKLLGLWAAEKLGFSGDEAEAYALALVQDDAAVPGYHDMLDKLFEDLEQAGKGISKHRIEKEMDRLLDEAKQQVLTA